MSLPGPQDIRLRGGWREKTNKRDGPGKSYFFICRWKGNFLTLYIKPVVEPWCSYGRLRFESGRKKCNKTCNVLNRVLFVCVVSTAEDDPCQTNPCLHGGSCLTEGEGYSCLCPQGYSGESCEIGKWIKREVRVGTKEVKAVSRSPQQL